MQKTDLQQGDVTRLATGFQFVEGPVWHPDGHWLFSDIPANRIHKISPNGALETYREPSGNSNGLTFAPQRSPGSLRARQPPRLPIDRARRR